jgi:magnesium transporter
VAKGLRGHGGKRGLPPGTLIHVGETRAEPVEITLYAYTPDETRQSGEPVSTQALPDPPAEGVLWINVAGVHDAGVVRAVGSRYGLHPLVAEDVMNTDTRPKMEDYPEALFFILKMLSYHEDREHIEAEQVSLFLRGNVVVSFQERPRDVFDPVRERIEQRQGRVCDRGADYLAYALLDQVVDNYFLVLEHLGDRIERAEEEVLAGAGGDLLEVIYRLRRELIFVRKCVWPLREVVSGLLRERRELITDDTRDYLRDVHDHTIQIIDTLESFREMLAGMVDVHLSMISNRMNEVMKVLTVIATIFIPLTFVAGIYGMNFEHMPELEWRWAYPVCLGAMALIAAGMLAHFRRKRWL